MNPIQFLRSHQRWLVVLLLFFIAAVNNLDRQALSVLAPTLREKLSFGPVEYSYVVASFLIAYTLGYAFCGRILDRIGVRLGLGLALAFWSIAGMLHAAAIGWISLACFRFLLGLGESFNSPAGVKAIGEWIPKRERGLCMAVVSNGNIMGAIIAPPLVSYLSLKLGWQMSFIITGALGFILLVIWWRFYDNPQRHRLLTQQERSLILGDKVEASPVSVGSASMWSLITHPACLAFFFARLLTDPLSFFFSFWLPDYLQHARGFSLAMIGMVGWIPFLAADVGGPGGGALSDWLVRRGWSTKKARLWLMGGAACLMPLSALAVRLESSSAALALIALLLAAQSCWMVNQLTLISESVPKDQTATLLALSAMGGSIGGTISTLVAGRVIASFGYEPVFTAIGFVHLVAFAALYAGLRRR